MRRVRGAPDRLIVTTPGAPRVSVQRCANGTGPGSDPASGCTRGDALRFGSIRHSLLSVSGRSGWVSTTVDRHSSSPRPPQRLRLSTDLLVTASTSDQRPAPVGLPATRHRVPAPAFSAGSAASRTLKGSGGVPSCASEARRVGRRAKGMARYMSCAAGVRLPPRRTSRRRPAREATAPLGQLLGHVGTSGSPLSDPSEALEEHVAQGFWRASTETARRAPMASRNSRQRNESGAHRASTSRTM